MFDFLASHDLILSVQKWSNPGLDFFFLAVTSLGEGNFFALALAYLFWCYDQKLAVRLASAFLFSAMLVYFLKVLFSLPRPDASIVLIHPSLVDLSESFPSGHAAGTTVFWGYLAFRLRKKWLTILSILLIVLVSFSRIYLGVHFLRDILGGIGLGLLVLLVAFPVISFWERKSYLLPEWLLWSISCGLPSLLAILSQDKRIAKCAGFLFGIWIGALVERKWVSFNPGRMKTGFSFSLQRKGDRSAIRPVPFCCFFSLLFSDMRRLGLGLLGAVLLYGSLKLIPWPAVRMEVYVTYGFMGFYLAALFPWILKKFRMKI